MSLSGRSIFDCFCFLVVCHQRDQTDCSVDSMVFFVILNDFYRSCISRRRIDDDSSSAYLISTMGEFFNVSFCFSSYRNRQRGDKMKTNRTNTQKTTDETNFMPFKIRDIQRSSIVYRQFKKSTYQNFVFFIFLFLWAIKRSKYKIEINRAQKYAKENISLSNGF